MDDRDVGEGAGEAEDDDDAEAEADDDVGEGLRFDVGRERACAAEE